MCILKFNAFFVSKCMLTGRFRMFFCCLGARAPHLARAGCFRRFFRCCLGTPSLALLARATYTQETCLDRQASLVLRGGRILHA